jgi:hypothetical protein
LHHLDSGTVREVVWGGDSVLRPGAGALEIVSPPLAIDAGVHQAEVYVEDRRHHARRAFRELSLIDAN